VAFSVVLKPAAVCNLQSLPEDARRRVATRIDALAGDPRPHGAEALRGEAGLYRIRMGDYRIISQVQGKALLVVVVRARHRREIYRGLGGKGPLG
jgi:mRNA interferase RelE/StbE